MESNDLLTRAREIPRGIGGHYYNIVQEMADEITSLRADREKCHDIMESQSHQLARMARDIEMFREMVAEESDGR